MADEPERATAFVRRYGWKWPSVVDADRELARTLGAEYQPFVALVDSSGRLVATHAGGGDEAVWRSLLETLDE